MSVLPETNQYMLVAKPIAEIKNAMEVAKGEIARNQIARKKYRDAIAYAIAELRIEGDQSAYRTGWNAAVEMAVEVVLRVRT